MADMSSSVMPVTMIHGKVTSGMAGDMLKVAEVKSDTAVNRSIGTFPRFGKDLHI